MPDFFPRIFGETEDQPLDADAANAALDDIMHQVNAHSKANKQPSKSRDEVKPTWQGESDTSRGSPVSRSDQSSCRLLQIALYACHPT